MPRPTTPPTQLSVSTCEPAAGPAAAAPASTAPSYVFIVRHGARLDMADPRWAASSPTPYDSPLTYNGWLQSRAVGARIASLIESTRSQQAQPSTSTNTTNDRSPEIHIAATTSRKRRLRVVIHSSPFLRCIQTSVSIATGIALYNQARKDAGIKFEKPLLRIDAWLGEWLNTEYYTDIAAPPPSDLFLAAAKSEYLRPDSGPPTPESSVSSSASSASLLSLQPLANALPVSSSFTREFVPPTLLLPVADNGPIPKGFFSHAKGFVDFDLGWDSTQLGAGAQTGEEWSSMHKRFRNGFKRLIGYYKTTDPEEATHATSLWRRHHHVASPPREMLEHEGYTMTGGNPTPPLSVSGEAGDEHEHDADHENENENDVQEEEEDVETVVILVSHGAGCNALIGAITDQPVLIDIPMASITMGQLRPPHPLPPLLPSPSALQPALPPSPPSSAKPHHTHMSFHTPLPRATSTDAPDPAVSYDLKLIASSEHLRSPPRGRAGSSAVSHPNSFLQLPETRSSRSASESRRAAPAATGGLWSLASRAAAAQEEEQRRRTEGKVEGLMKPEVIGKDARAAAGLRAAECGRREEERRRAEAARMDVARQIPVGGDAVAERVGGLDGAVEEEGDVLVSVGGGLWGGTGAKKQPLWGGTAGTAGTGEKKALWGQSAERRMPKRRWTVGRSEF